MTFTIDTGSAATAHGYSIDHVQLLLQAVKDELPEAATQSQIDDLICQYVIGDLRQPKRLETVRNHLLRYWPLIAPLASREPELFDSVILEMAEIISEKF